jgi:hypothetical protein
MKLYKTEYLDDGALENRQNRIVWDGTQTDAAKTRKRLKGEGMRDIETFDVEVPTDKKGLLEFLNT